MLSFNHTIYSLNDLEKEVLLKNIAGKEENAGYHHFLLFPSKALFLKVTKTLSGKRAEVCYNSTRR